MKKFFLLMTAMSLLVSCASSNKVMFVTKTSLAILEADTKPAGISIAYDRIEGYIGPSYANGAVPPVVAFIDSNGKIIDARVNQLYATGNAAALATSITDQDPPDPQPGLSGEKRLMFFGTTTKNGISISTTNNIPDSIVFGYKRKEFSYIPVGTVDDVDHYPSVVASINTTGNTNAETGTALENPEISLTNRQVFATGTAAEHLAVQLRPEFRRRAELSLNLAQQAASSRVFRCYAGVVTEHKPAVWEDAHRLDLFQEDEAERGTILGQLRAAHAAAIAATRIDLAALARADRLYAASLNITDENDTERLENLAEHEAAVCQLSRLNVSGG